MLRPPTLPSQERSLHRLTEELPLSSSSQPARPEPAPPPSSSFSALLALSFPPSNMSAPTAKLSKKEVNSNHDGADETSGKRGGMGGRAAIFRGGRRARRGSTGEALGILVRRPPAGRGRCEAPRRALRLGAGLGCGARVAQEGARGFIVLRHDASVLIRMAQAAGGGGGGPGTVRACNTGVLCCFSRVGDARPGCGGL